MILSNLISKGLNFISVSVLAKFLSVFEFGFYNSLLSNALSVNQISDFGFSLSLQKNIAQFYSDTLNIKKLQQVLSTTFVIGLFINFFLVTIVYVNLDFFSNSFFKIPEMEEFIFPFLSIIIAQFLLQIPTTILLNIGNFKVYSKINTISSVLSLILSTTLTFKFGINGCIIAYLISTLINAFIFWFAFFSLLKHRGIRFYFSFSWESVNNILSNGFIYYIGNVLLGAIASIFTISMYSNFINLEGFAYIRISGSINALITMLPAAIIPVAFSFLALSNTNQNMVFKTMQIKWTSIMVFITTIVLILLIKPLILLFFKEDYLLGISIISQLAFINFIVVMQSVYVNFFLIRGESNKIGLIAILALIIHIIMLYYLIPIYGSLGYVISLLVPNLISHFITVYFEITNKKNILGYKDELRKFYLLFIPFVLTGFFILFFVEVNFYKNIFLFINSGLLLIVFFKKSVTKEELNYLRRQIKF
jgi:O-antigen/teichoic acid export membrane protein